MDIEFCKRLCKENKVITGRLKAIVCVQALIELASLVCVNNNLYHSHKDHVGHNTQTY